MNKQEIINSTIDDLKEEHDSKFRTRVREIFVQINNISKNIIELERQLINRRKELKELEPTDFEIQL